MANQLRSKRGLVSGTTASGTRPRRVQLQDWEKGRSTRPFFSMKHVLIISISQDVHADRVEKLVSVSAPVIRLNMDDPNEWNFEYKNGEPNLRYQSKEFGIENIKSVFLRRLPSPKSFQKLVPKNLGKFTDYIVSQKYAIFQECLSILSRTVTFLNPLRVNEFLGKTIQHFIANRHGLITPETYVGENPDSAKKFIQEFMNNGVRICTKPVENIKIELEDGIKTRFTQLLTPSLLPEINSLKLCPLIFQTYTEKLFEVRGTIVGSKILACRIDSQAAPGDTAIDWRRYNIPKTPHYKYQIPTDIERKIISFHKEIEAVYSSFDLIVDKTGNHIFLETNPYGQWLWIEDLTGLPISKALSEKLLS